MSNDVYERLRTAIYKITGAPDDFEVKWSAVIDRFTSWNDKLPALLSPLTKDLTLEFICDTFNTAERIRQDETIASIVLEGTLEPGQEAQFAGKRYTVINRTISANFGVLYRLKSENGDIIIITHEFFD